MKKKAHLVSISAAFIAFTLAHSASADVLCKVKKTGAVVSRPACKKKETPISQLETVSSSTSTTADVETGVSVTLQDSGAVSQGNDVSRGVEVSVVRQGATGGTLNNIGMSVEVFGDTGGDSTNVGLSVNASGADNNYSALFSGGNVGIGVSDPDELLELAGRLHLGVTSAPSDTAGKLYNVGGSLFWNGEEVQTGVSTGGTGTITGVTAGSGLTGGGTSGTVSLSIDSGTTANKVVQLNSSAELPAVSGANLTTLNAASISSGSLSDGRLSSNVSLLGSSIGLSSEVAGTLPIANGGTGATSLNNLISLGAHSTGNYVASVSTSGGVTGGAAGSEGATLSLSVDQTFSPNWSGTHSFQGSTNFGTTTSSIEAMHLNGRLHIEPALAPLTTTDKLYNVGGALFFNGQNISSTAAGGDITDVVAGTGLTGGATSGSATLNVDVGTTANKIVQLNGSAALPAVSGANLSSLNASSISSGTVSDARLSSSVSLLGSSIALGTEVTGTLPILNGGTGTTTLADLISLGTHTSGNYVAAVAAGTGISLNSTGVEGGTATLSLDQAVAPSWTSTHTFSGIATDITTGTNQHFSIVPNGTGNVGIGTTSPSAKLDTVLSSTATSADLEVAQEIDFVDSGVVNSGTDTSVGLDVNVQRTGATGGTIASTGIDVTVSGGTGGNQTATGLNVLVSGADTNFAALFSGGNVGIGTTVPTARLHTIRQSGSLTAATEVAAAVEMVDTGVIGSGLDESVGLSIDVSRLAASTGGTIDSKGLEIQVTGDSNAASTTTGLSVAVSGADTNYAALFLGGNVGIGTAMPSARLHTSMTSTSAIADTEVGSSIDVADTGIIAAGSDETIGLQIDVSKLAASVGGTIQSTGLDIVVTGDANAASLTTGLSVAVSGADTNVAAQFSGGSVAIGNTTTVSSASVPSGSLVVTNGVICVEDGDDKCDDAPRTAGTVYAENTLVTFVDLAEEFPIEHDDEVEAGDIVAIDTHEGARCVEVDSSNNSRCVKLERGLIPFVTRSSGIASENKRIIGIVSTKPGIVLGGFGQEDLANYSKVPVALAGRVPVKVNGENGPIELGDRIAPSSVPGMGRRAGANDHVIGIALTPFDGATPAVQGEVLALVK